MKQKKLKNFKNFSKNLNVLPKRVRIWEPRKNTAAANQKKKKKTNGRESRTANFVTVTVETEGNLIQSRFLHVEREGPKAK